MGPRPLLFAALACLLPVSAARAATPDMPSPATKAPDLSAEAFVVEQSEVTVHFARDGSSVRTWHIREHVQSDSGVRTVGIVSVPFAALTQTVTFDYVRVRKPSGQIVSTPVDGAQEVPLPVTQQAPMYSDLRMKQLPVQSLSVGDTLEYQVSLKSTNADVPGAFWFQADFTTGVPVQSETYEIYVPRDVPMVVKSKGTAPAVSDKGSERTYRWQHETASDYPKKQEKDTTAQVSLVQETYEPDIALSSFRSWVEVGAWYRGLIRDRALPDAAIRAKADELTRGLTTDDARVDALYNYVATQYRYIAVSFGVGRLQPHAAAEVFRNQYGDCKDKHTLLEAMLAAEKINAVPVLVNSSLRVNEAIPIPSQFDHMITLVKLKDHDVWLDATPEIAPARVLMAGLRDKLALALPQNEEARLVKTPATLPFPSYVQETIKGKLDAKGTLTAHFDLTLRGDDEVIYRAVYHTVSRAQWQQAAQQISYNSGFAGEVSALDASLPEKTGEPFHVAWDYTRKDYGDWPNRRFPGLTPWFEMKLADDATAPKRPIALDPTADTEVKIAIELPEDYTLEAPADVKRTTPFAEYVSTYAVKGHTLEMDRALRYKAREISVSDFPAYREFLKAVSDDAGQMLQLISTEIATTTTTRSVDHRVASDFLKRARQKIDAHDLRGARDLLDQAQSGNDREENLWLAYGDIDFTSDPGLAITDYKKELENHPASRSTVYPILLNTYVAVGKWDDLEPVLQQWISADPKNAQAQSALRAVEFLQRPSTDLAISYQESLAPFSFAERSSLRFAQAQLRAGDAKAGTSLLHDIVERTQDPANMTSAAYYLADAGVDLAFAEATSRKAVSIIEDRSSSVSLQDAGNESLFNERLLAGCWGTLGWVLAKEKKLPEAEIYLSSAWSLNPNPTLGEQLARTYLEAGKRSRALETYRHTLKLMGSYGLPPALQQKRQAVIARISALKASGIREQQIRTDDGDDFLAGRRYTIPSPLHGESASADFLLLLGDRHAEDVRFLKGDEALRNAAPTLLSVSYREGLPSGSKAKILRHGAMFCPIGSSTCNMQLFPTAEGNPKDAAP
jgi:tetratricopeptide (TPR) repeat protein